LAIPRGEAIFTRIRHLAPLDQRGAPASSGFGITTIVARPSITIFPC
jgi:hypothetical protein